MEPHVSLNRLSGGHPVYPEPVRALLAQQSNQYSMRLRPTIQDGFLNMQYPVFSVDRAATSGKLYHALRDQYSRITNIAPAPSALVELTQAAQGSIVVPTTWPQNLSNTADTILRNLSTNYQQLFAKPLEYTQAEMHQEILSVLGFTDADIQNAAEFNELLEGIVNLIKLKADIQPNILPPEPPFNSVRVPIGDTKVETLNIMTQFLLAEINFYAHSQGLTTANFGQILDANNPLAVALAQVVIQALAQGRPVVTEVIKFINTNSSTFSLTRNNKIDDVGIGIINKRFTEHYNLVQSSAHKDEFMTLDLTKPGRFFAHQGNMCFDFTDLMSTAEFAHLNTPEFQTVNAEIGQIPTVVPSRDPAQIGVREIDTLDFQTEVKLAIQEAIADDTSDVKFNKVRQLLLLTEEYQVEESGEIVTKTRKVFEGLGRNFFAEFDNDPRAQKFFVNVRRAITNSTISNQFNKIVRGHDTQLLLTPDMARALYSYAVATTEISPNMTNQFRTQDSLEKLLNHLRIANITLTAGYNGNFVIDASQSVINDLNKMIENGNPLTHLSTQMARSLYKAVTERYGENSDQVKAMERLNNNDIPPQKILKACALLDIPVPETIAYPNNGEGMNGYIIYGLSDDSFRMIQEIHNVQAQRFRLTKDMAQKLYSKVIELNPFFSRFIGMDGSLSNYERPDKLEATLIFLGIDYTRVEFNEFDGYWIYLDEAEQQKINHIAGIPRNVSEPDLIPGYLPSVSSLNRKDNRSYLFNQILIRSSLPSQAQVNVETPVQPATTQVRRGGRFNYAEGSGDFNPLRPFNPQATPGRRGRFATEAPQGSNSVHPVTTQESSPSIVYPQPGMRGYRDPNPSVAALQVPRPTTSSSVAVSQIDTEIVRQLSELLNQKRIEIFSFDSDIRSGERGQLGTNIEYGRGSDGTELFANANFVLRFEDNSIDVINVRNGSSVTGAEKESVLRSFCQDLQLTSEAATSRETAPTIIPAETTLSSSPSAGATLSIGSVIPTRTVAQQLGVSLSTNVSRWNDQNYKDDVNRLKAQVLGNIANYTPNMPTVAAVSATARTSSLGSGVGLTPAPLYFIQGVDALAVGFLPCFQNNAVVQVAGQANGTENTSPRVVEVENYPYDRTQGPRSQMLDPSAALGRRAAEIEAGGYSSRSGTVNRNSQLPRQGVGCDFLAEWRNKPNFNNIFEEQDGYIHPRPGQVQNAVEFLNSYINELRINIERINPGLDANKSMIQVIAFAFALGNTYGGENFSGRGQYLPAEKVLLDQACQLLLKAQYELIADIAIIEARNNPGRRVPLVLTLVGAGVFENTPEAVYGAVAAAIQRVQSSGLPNVDVCISAYGQQEVQNVQRYMQQLGYNGPVLTNAQLNQPTLAACAGLPTANIATPTPLTAPTVQSPSIATTATRSEPISRAQPTVVAPSEEELLLRTEFNRMFTIAPLSRGQWSEASSRPFVEYGIKGSTGDKAFANSQYEILFKNDGSTVVQNKTSRSEVTGSDKNKVLKEFCDFLKLRATAANTTTTAPTTTATSATTTTTNPQPLVSQQTIFSQTYRNVRNMLSAPPTLDDGWRMQNINDKIDTKNIPGLGDCLVFNLQKGSMVQTVYLSPTDKKVYLSNQKKLGSGVYAHYTDNRLMPVFSEQKKLAVWVEQNADALIELSKDKTPGQGPKP